jgi:hypothetical protein
MRCLHGRSTDTDITKAGVPAYGSHQATRSSCCKRACIVPVLDRTQLISMPQPELTYDFRSGSARVPKSKGGSCANDWDARRRHECGCSELRKLCQCLIICGWVRGWQGSLSHGATMLSQDELCYHCSIKLIPQSESISYYKP